jgi:hypothetical protein
MERGGGGARSVGALLGGVCLMRVDVVGGLIVATGYDVTVGESENSPPWWARVSAPRRG